MDRVTSELRDSLIAGFAREALHLEMRDFYAAADHSRFRRWLAGEQFDPVHHEAMAQQPVEGAESGTVVEVYQPGYRLNGTVIRPARVVVAA